MRSVNYFDLRTLKKSQVRYFDKITLNPSNLNNFDKKIKLEIYGNKSP